MDENYRQELPVLTKGARAMANYSNKLAFIVNDLYGEKDVSK